MSDIDSAADALMALAKNSEGRKKTARLRQLLPQIEAAAAAGVSQAKIVEVLNQEGLDITQNTYSVMLSRLRKQREKTGLVKPASVARIGAEVKVIVGTDGDAQPPSSKEQKPGEPRKLVWDTEKNGQKNHWE